MAGQVTDQVTELLERIERLDVAALADEIRATQNQLRGLQFLERARAARDGEEPKRRKKTAQPVQPKLSLADRPLKERAIEYLRYGQPAKTGILAAELDVTPEDIQTTLSQFPDEFELLQVGWIRRRSGRQTDD